MNTDCGRLFIYGLEVLNTQTNNRPSYGPLDAGRVLYSPQQKFYCHRCEKNFATQEQLTQHLWDKHPTKNPILIFGDTELTSTRHIVRNRFPLENVSVLNAELINVNGNEVTLKKLNKLIGSATNQFFRIDITNEGVNKKFELDIKLISDSYIQNIDECFFNCFNNSQLTNDGIQTFIKLTNRYTDAADYIDGLLNYLVGLQAKVGRASVVSFEKYAEKLNQSFSILSEFKNPLAVAICDVISFMMNTFNEVSDNGPLLQVNAAIQFLLSGTHRALPVGASSSIAQLPIDNATHNILDLINNELADFKGIGDAESKVSALYKQYDFSPVDKDKVNLILFWKAHEVGDNESQKQYKKKLMYWDEIEKVIANNE
jgi:hypothetical protein